MAFEDLLEVLCKIVLWTKVFCCSHPKKFTFPKEEAYNGEPGFFSELYREMLLLFLELGCSYFHQFAVSAFKTHLESCLVLFSKGWKKGFWFPPSVYRREILQTSTWFLISKAGFSTKELLQTDLWMDELTQVQNYGIFVTAAQPTSKIMNCNLYK